MTFKSKTIAGFGTAVIIMALVCVVSYRSMVRSSVDRQWVTHTHQVIEKLDAVQGNITDAETGQRGYLLTGEQPYLDPYKSALDHVHENLRELRELTSDNPVRQRALDLLNPVIAQKLRELQERIDER
ncbi:MAG: CHASE3 domain-containing protein, partial [Candidatus Acidiferrales bacterium]